MTFDPFGDFETRGYLRNLPQEKDAAIVRRLEHASFTTGLVEALPFVRLPVANLPKHVAATKGLDGVALGTDTVQGRNDDPAVQARYEQQRIKRGAPQGGR